MNPAPTILRIVVLGTMLVLGACSVVPTSGPAAHDVRTGQPDPESLPYAYVPVTPKVVDILATNTPRLSTAFKDERRPQRNSVRDRRRRQRYLVRVGCRRAFYSA